MGLVVPIESRRVQGRNGKTLSPRERLPRMLAQLLAAGATDFTRVALDAWGNQEMDPEELVELCTTYASVAGLENLSL